MLTQDGEETFITVNRWKAPEEDVRKVLEEIKGAASQLIKADASRYPENGHARFTAKEELDVPEWLEAVRRATDDIKNGKYDKVVLAREILLTFDQPVELHRVLFNLMSEQKRAIYSLLKKTAKVLSARHLNDWSKRRRQRAVDLPCRFNQERRK